MSIKKYVIRAIGAFATVATLTACNGAPKPDEKERDDIFGPFFDNGTPRDAVGRHLPFGPDGCKGAIHVTGMKIKPNNKNGNNLCLVYATMSDDFGTIPSRGLTYCRPVKKIETGAAGAPTAKQ